MKKLIYVTAILLFGAFALACGGKTETKETETKQVSTPKAANSNLAVIPADADDKGKKDADDMPPANVNQNRNANIKRDADDKNRSNARRDAGDSGKRENDRDADDN